MTAIGSRKMAAYDDLATEERIPVLDKGVDPRPGSDDLNQPPMSYRYGDILVRFLASHEPLAVQARHFVNSILTQSPPLTDGENGLGAPPRWDASVASAPTQPRTWVRSAMPAPW
jgi:hypothetical protein